MFIDKALTYKGTKCGRKITSWKLLWNSLNDKLFSYICEVIKCKDQKPGEKMGLIHEIQRSMRSMRSMRSRDPWDPEQEIDQWSHKREELHNLWRKFFSANAMERDQWSIIRLKTWTNHLPVADSVRRIEICMGRSRVERLQHVEGRPDVSEWEGSQNNQAKLHFLKGDNLTKYESSARLVESARRESLKLQARPSQFRLPRENLAFERSS